jgi:lipopolysaccharide biosynthesis glycosyltransferase
MTLKIPTSDDGDKMEPVRIYVGADRSQLLAVKILEHSIKRHTNLTVQVFPMLDLPIKKTKDPRQGQRTGFSFSRFCIPDLAGYTGKAIYMDADMLVFRDISELWNWQFDNHTVLLQRPLLDQQASKANKQTSEKRIRQCAVMVIDCQKNKWKIDDIIDDLDSQKFSYEDLMYRLCILEDEKIGEVLPFEWNSLEHYDQRTCLIHYTDMNTQPWVSTLNQNASKWYSEVSLMLSNKSLGWSEIFNEVKEGYFRPSLAIDILLHSYIPLRSYFIYNSILRALDILLGYTPHKTVYAAKAERDKLIKKNQSP